MARYEVCFDGRRQEWFYDRDQAMEWAEEVAATGRVVDVVSRNFFGFRKFLTAFPESARAQRAAEWSIPLVTAFTGFVGGAGGGGDGGGGGGGC